MFTATIPDRGVDYCYHSYSGMLVLEKKSKGRPRFLGLLDGLRNSKEFIGLVSAYIGETRLEAEMKWLVEH